MACTDENRTPASVGEILHRIVAVIHRSARPARGLDGPHEERADAGLSVEVRWDLGARRAYQDYATSADVRPLGDRRLHRVAEAISRSLPRQG